MHSLDLIVNPKVLKKKNIYIYIYMHSLFHFMCLSHKE